MGLTSVFIWCLPCRFPSYSCVHLCAVFRATLSLQPSSIIVSSSGAIFACFLFLKRCCISVTLHLFIPYVQISRACPNGFEGVYSGRIYSQESLRVWESVCVKYFPLFRFCVCVCVLSLIKVPSEKVTSIKAWGVGLQSAWLRGCLATQGMVSSCFNKAPHFPTCSLTVSDLPAFRINSAS